MISDMSIFSHARVSPLERCLLRSSTCFLIEFFLDTKFYEFFTYLSSLCVLDINSLSDI